METQSSFQYQVSVSPPEPSDMSTHFLFRYSDLKKLSAVRLKEQFNQKICEVKFIYYVKDTQKETSEVIPIKDTPHINNISINLLAFYHK